MNACMKDGFSSSLDIDADGAWALNILPLFLWSLYYFQQHSLSMCPILLKYLYIIVETLISPCLDGSFDLYDL